MFRGEVSDDRGAKVMRTRAPELARVIARMLNGEDVDRAQVQERSPVSRYQVAHGRSEDEQLIIGVESSVRNPSRFGDGVLASTDDASLAHEAARLLNEIDPRPRPRVQRGMGWW
jgi:hypothetical protein